MVKKIKNVFGADAYIIHTYIIYYTYTLYIHTHIYTHIHNFIIYIHAHMHAYIHTKMTNMLKPNHGRKANLVYL